MRRKPTAFPVGLYGMLLFALCWLTLPAVFAPLERCLLGGACAIGRLWAAVVARPAHAASAAARSQLAELSAGLQARVRAHGVDGVPAAWVGRAQPVHCTVLSVARRGGGGEFAELRLDRTYRELAGCRSVVTKGDLFVGFLQTPGRGAAVDDMPDDHARVLLPNHPACPPLHAELATADPARLRFVVRGAAIADPAPLRVDLWDDPYRASRVDRGGEPVRTRDVPTGRDVVPGGLLLGTTRVWGYQREDGGQPLTLGVYVAPAVRAAALSHVVLWHDEVEFDPALPLWSAPPDAPVHHTQPAVVHELPGAVHGRHLLVGAAGVADGAAVTEDGYLLGTARGLAFGVALVTSFAASRQPWNLVLLPDAPDAVPVEFAGDVVRADGERVWLRCRIAPGGGGPGALVAMRESPGYLFTGSNGHHCPAGLWIGRAQPEPNSLDLWLVTVPVRHGARGVQVVHGREQP